MYGLAASSSFQHGREALSVFCSQEVQLRLFFPSLQLEYLSWLRGLFLDQYFGHGPVCWCVCVLAAGVHALAPYSNVGLTAPVYTVLIILELAPQCVPASFSAGLIS